MRLLWKLLRRHLSIWQIAGFSLANVFGLAVILVSALMWHDVLSLFDGRDALAGDSYVVISKPFDTVSSALGNDKVFTGEDVRGLEQQDAVKAVGKFTPSTYEVYARITLGNGGMQMATDMFFESVPDGFVDVESAQWRFVQGGKYLPIILPRNYLDLYNFGFAPAKGMPKVSPDVAGMLNITIEVNGRGRSDEYLGFIAGFSDRLNTILVPQSFMDFANAAYGSAAHPAASRLILQVSDPSDEALALYIKDKGYTVSDGDDDSGRLAFFLRVVLWAVMSVGVFICGLAFLLFVLSIYLLLEKNVTKLENLLLLGYSPARVASPYLLLASFLGLLQAGCAILIAMAVRRIYLDELRQMFEGVGSDGACVAGGVACGLLLLQLLLDWAVIMAKVRNIAR